ncbi:MAG: B12-binding domain-containing radical SAM protein [Pseudonocardiaceae bacterium]
MHDLSLLRDGDAFSLSPSVPARIALVHHSFRTVSVRRGQTRQRFAAHFPALGLLSIAQSLRVEGERGRFDPPEMRYFDQEVYPDEQQMADAIESWLAPSGRRIVAASSYTSTVDRLEEFLGRFDPSRYLIVVGGAHASLAPDIKNTHFVVRGEGAAAFRHILTTFLSPRFGEGSEAAGVCYQLDGCEVVRRQAFDRSIEELPPPVFAYDLLPDQVTYGQVYATNFTRMLGQCPQVYICTQSCAARCTFCSTYLIHGRHVARSPDLVARDIDHLVRTLGHDSLEFHDDDLMQHPELGKLLDVLGNIGVPWFCYARVERIDQATARRLATAGCRRVFLGIETMRQANLDYFNKQTTVAQNRTAVEHLAAVGIGVVAGFIIGSPDDTVASILFDLGEFLSLPLFAINCSILSPDPGTAEFRRARRRSRHAARS